ncbi:MAG: bifunctional diaminohydroxyphosphoribosylaminopyrimidine deaminase/5-amino-6-(5-phosphoribosylamino)uracil reductase RibD [Synechococcaceae bacterium WB9_2_170]|nr:bifunctional diaminohydroxyphosphoribosylaminopyrimidine deaminase/5-amino-6-(5-phosphoribosylamino)uracil reductase RibD [Synechococcaceae bacterium WB9_2_170]
MQRALQLAALGRGRTSPNPMVGALVLDGAGELVGEGFHAKAGHPHAEVGALLQAGDRARGGTLVVTLEPCCHHGRTPPCTEAVIAAGIQQVVVAMADPNPLVAGGGIGQLTSAGIAVIQGVCEAEAQALNRAFSHRIHRGRPFGILKWAMGLDGRTALSNGASQWISSPEARAWVHTLRGSCDAVIVGGGTVRADRPELAAAALRDDCVQEIAAVIAPKVMGGIPARTPIGELGFHQMDQVASWQSLAPASLGPDLLWRLRSEN